LVKLGADINKENIIGETPLFKAYLSGNKALVKYLIEQGEDVNKENKLNGQTPLSLACEKENEVIVKYLVEHGAIIDKEDNYDETLVRYLVELGADINKENKHGKTPLFNARSSENIAVEKYLMIHKKFLLNEIPLSMTL